MSGCSDLPFDETVRLDLWYVDNWSMVRDLRLLMRTGHAVLVGRGAC
ncbi:sugar transferase [Streptomyces sp. NBC_01589]